MGVKFGSTAGYMYMDMWVLAGIIQLGTFSFCRRFLNQSNDPCGRLFDQMTQAARSGQANIAEGVSRHQTSIETEMKLVDVARASINELSNDYAFFLMNLKQAAWRNNDPEVLLVLCSRVNSMITRYLDNRLETFKQEGGFTENMTKERLEAQRQQSVMEGAPTCPKCGAPMVQRYAKRGVNQGKAFWSCSKYRETGCTGSRNIPNQ